MTDPLAITCHEGLALAALTHVLEIRCVDLREMRRSRN